MKKNIILTIVFAQAYFFTLQGQIGINTETPKGIFHIDAKRNTSATATGSSTQTLDDITVSYTGNIGIGTVEPQVKLHIATGGTASSPITGLKLADGTHASGKILTSDIDGNVSWKGAPLVPTAVATRVGAQIPSNTAQYYNTKSYISLPPGRWKVTATILITGFPFAAGEQKSIHDKLWAHAFFSEAYTADTPQPGTLISPDVESGKKIAALVTKYSYNMMIGNTIINNKTNTTKKYYYYIGAFNQLGTSLGNVTFRNVGSSANAENSIVAVLIQDE